VKRADEEQVVEIIRAYFKYLDLECVLDVAGRLVPICSDDNVPENEHGVVLDSQIQDQKEKVIEHKPEAESMAEQEKYEREFEADNFAELEDVPGW
jgi:hypothetical protein